MSFFELITNMSEFEWRQPWWLLLMLQPLLLWLVVNFKNKQANNQFADDHLLPWVQIDDKKSLLQKIFSRNTAYWLSMILLAIAMSGPRTPLESPDKKHVSALDIMVVVDVSASMKAQDIEPSRLQRGAQELYELLTRVERDDVRFGSVVYAARPHVFVPMTNDFDALKFYLKDLNELVLPTKGSDAVSALLMAGRELQSVKRGNKTDGQTDQKQAKAILWLSDGDFANRQDKTKIEATLKQLKAQNIPTFILGLGTSSGAAIPLREGGWLEQNGQGVISKMDADLLEDFARIGGGKFSEVYNDDSEWNTLYTQGLLNSAFVETKASAKSEDQLWAVYYPWFLFPAIMLLLIALVPLNLSVIGFKRIKPTLAFVLGFVLVGLLFNTSSNIYANETSDESIAVSVDKSVSKSIEKNTTKNVNSHVVITDPVLQESVKNYNEQEYELASPGFMSIVLQAQSESDRGKAMHNLGNNYFQQGDYGNAAKLYRDALRYTPDQVETQKNLELTRELNTLLQRRRQRATQSRENQADGREPAGNQNQTGNMMISRQIVPKNLKLPEIPKAHLNQLLDKGLAHLQILESPEAIMELERQRKIEQAKISLLRDQDSSLEMWKRLFEIEEGFPAKLKAPKSVPGQQPW